MATDLARKIRGSRIRLGESLRNSFVKAVPVHCEPLTFGDLPVGSKFIFFPTPGDNSGHGGFLNGSYIFMKINHIGNMYEHTGTDFAIKIKAVKLLDGGCIDMSDTDFVIKVE